MSVDAAGHDASGDEALRGDVRALAFRDEELAAVQEGVSEMEAGRLHPFEEVDVEIHERFGFPKD